jgi:hypothetical protein
MFIDERCQAMEPEAMVPPGGHCIFEFQPDVDLYGQHQVERLII